MDVLIGEGTGPKGAEAKPMMVQKKKPAVGVSNLGGVQRVKKVSTEPSERPLEKE